MSKLLTLVLALFSIGAASAQDPPADPRRDVERVIGAWLAQEPRRPTELVDALTGLGRRASPRLCELLDGDRAGAPPELLAEAIGRLGSYHGAPASLGRLLESDAAAHRLGAVTALSRLRMREACPYIVLALEDPEGPVSSMAEKALLDPAVPGTWVAWAAERHLTESDDLYRLARVLARKRQPETHATLIRLVGDRRTAAQLAGLQGLCIDGHPEDGETILDRLVSSDSTEVQRQACLALGKIGHVPAARDLIDLLHHPDRGLVKNAHWALQKITGLRLRSDPELWERWWERVGSRREGEQSGAARPR